MPASEQDRERRGEKLALIQKMLGPDWAFEREERDALRWLLDQLEAAERDREPVTSGNAETAVQQAEQGSAPRPGGESGE